jgi:hypothetical protein
MGPCPRNHRREAPHCRRRARTTASLPPLIREAGQPAMAALVGAERLARADAAHALVRPGTPGGQSQTKWQAFTRQCGAGDLRPAFRPGIAGVPSASTLDSTPYSPESGPA